MDGEMKMNGYNCTHQLELANIHTSNGRALLLVWLILVVFIITSNTMLIIGLSKTNQVKCYTHRFLMVISATDLCVALIDFPLTMLTNNIMEPSCNLMKAADIVSGFLDTFTVLNTFGMGVDRYIFIMNPTRKNAYTKKYAFKLYIFVSFAFSITMNGIGYDKVDKFTSDNTPLILIILSSILSVFMLLMLYINIKLIRYISRHGANIRRMSAHDLPRHYSARAARTISYISIVLVIAYTPIIVKNVILSYYFLTNPAVLNFSSVILIHIWMAVPWYCYSGLNSTIFMLRNRKVRRFWTNTLTNVKEALYFGKRKTVTITEN